MKNLITTLLTLAVFCALNAQSTFHNPDKVYLHLDRNLYAQGDTIWIKGYAMERGSNKPSDKSHSIHVQMLDEVGQQVGAYKLLNVDGVAQGQIPISSVIAPGFYQLIAHTGYMKNFDQRFFFKTSIEVRRTVRKKTMRLQFDQAQYKDGDTAKVTFTMLDQQEMPVGDARFICDYRRGEELIKRHRYRCYDDGTLEMPIVLETGEEKALPKLRLSYFEEVGDEHPIIQEVAIPMRSENVRLEFFPEGGDLIQGLFSKVAFKATDSRGLPVDVGLDLYEEDKKIAQIKSVHQGMGIMPFTPKEKTYSVRISSHESIDSVYQLPKVKSKGYTLSLNAQNEEAVILGISHNYEDERLCKLWISYCDSLLEVKELNVRAKSQFEWSKKNLPEGIVTFTLSENDVPQAERLVYIDKPDSKLTLDVSGTLYEPRQMVELTLNTNNQTKAMLSYAVVDSLLSNSPKLFPANIKAYAQFESELKGQIINPNQYLGSDRSTANKRDLLLVTHGWRRFEWIANEKSLRTMKVYDFNRVKGQVTRLRKPYANAKISAYMLGETILYSEFESDDQGRFYIDPVYKERIDQNLLIMSRNRKGRRGITLRLNDTDTLLFSSVVTNNSNNLLAIHQYNTKSEEVRQPVLFNESFLLDDPIWLKEFEVSAQKKELDMADYFKSAEDVAYGKDLEDASSFYWMVQQFSNIVNEADNGYRLRVKTNDVDRPHVQVFIDEGLVDLVYGFELDVLYGGINCKSAMIYVNGKPWGYDVAPLDYLKASDISSIAILDGIKGEELFGIEAYYGAIMVETYDKNIVNQHKLHNSHAVFGNFVRARQFTKPIYETQEQIKTIGDDNRITLHWEALLETDENGKAEVSFYTGDIPGKKQIVVQGFDEEGNLYYQTGSFMVKDVLER